MNNSPGWASPGSAPSDEPDRGTQEQPTQPPAAEGRPGSAEQPPPNWSKQQPPAGQWSAPTGIPGQSGTGDRTRAAAAPGHQAGWGGGPGWGSGWGAPPQAAKPGVIPLRPLGVGEILDGAIATLRAHWRTVLGISLIVAVVSQTAVTVVTGLWFQDAGRAPSLEDRSGPPLRDTMRDIGNSLTGTGITSLIGLLATIIATGMLTMVVSRAVLGRSVTAAEAWRDARAQLPRLLGLLVLLPLLFLTVMAVCLAPGILVAATGTLDMGLVLALFGGLAATVVSVWLWVRYSLASPALMLEKQGVIASLRRSAKLVRGSWWRVLGVQLLTYLLLLIIEFAVQIPTTLIAFLTGGESLMEWAEGTNSTTGWTFLIVLGVGAVISSTLSFPISAGVTALIYMDQRIRREALDLELARAAGLPAYGTEAPVPQPATAPDDTPSQTAPVDSAPVDSAPADSSRAETSTADTPRVDATAENAPSTTPTSPDAPADGTGEHPTDATPGS
ncbi:hypothetical protein FCH28_37765 [Streptomyces piniterrae]|uniref:DUF7847 domain-containing protein n=1 Tax=Streptomyces piniterrae TaxID=2571125 RepID=A0A4U0MHD3_9ACTN|nr:hypothetical protein [Streptomyces piniterrae]TJZ39940.1 hypothetical protein FCH28_37765 [Streptomyces piniterrae]